MNAPTREDAAPHVWRGGGLRHDLPVLPRGAMAFALLLVLLLRIVPASPAHAGDAARPPEAHTPSTPDRNEAPAPASAMDAPVATLLHASGDVELRIAEGARRGDGNMDEALHAGDAVQTLTRSRALLRIGKQDYLGLGERSVLVFGAGRAGVDTAAPRRATLLAGSLSGSFGSSGADVPFELELPGARLSPAGAPDDALRFLVSRNAGSASSISVLSGRARLARAHGAELLTAGVGVTLDAHGNLRERRALPPPPDTLAPPGGSVLVYRDVPPRIAFTWGAVGRHSHYRLRVASDVDFHELLADERIGAASCTLSSLHAGEYYWSVSSLDGRHEGRPSVPRRLRILRDSVAPALTVDALAEASGPVVVRGHTEPGASVYVQGEAVAAAPDGTFERRIVRRPGAFLLRVEAVDSVGNVSANSRVVIARDAERATVADTDPET